MGTTLTGTTPQDTYDSLIKVTDNGPLSGTAKYLSDGLGNDSALALSTTAVGIGTNSLFGKFNLADGSNARLESTPVADGVAFEVLDSTRTNPLDFKIFANDILFNTKVSGSYTERMRIDSAGNVGIGTGSPAVKLDVTGDIRSTVGLRIGANADGTTGQFLTDNTNTFLDYKGFLSIRTAATSTEVARFLSTGGLTFNGDTAAANALDDYEEGTFTPAAIGTTSAGTANYYQQFGRYTKIGRTVNFQLFIAYDTGTGTGNLRISGLPFTATSTNVNNALAIGYFDVVSLTASHVATSWIENGTTELGIYQYPVGGGAAAVVAYDSAANISISGTYIV